MRAIRFFSSGRLLGIAIACLVSPPAAFAQTPPDLADLVGARGAGGETQMQARGYVLVRAAQERDRSWTFWWSATQRVCVAVATANGRYATIRRTPDSHCQSEKSSSAFDANAGRRSR